MKSAVSASPKTCVIGRSPDSLSRVLGWLDVSGHEIEIPKALLDSKPWVDRFAFERQYTKDALVCTPQRFFADESLQCFDAECELTGGKRPFGAETAGTEPIQVFRQKIFRAVDDA
jgi:hypothetical protein